MSVCRIGVLLGDAAGIGPEIVAKIFLKNKHKITKKFLLIGDLNVFQTTLNLLKSRMDFKVITDANKIKCSEEPILFYDLKTLVNLDFKIGESSKSCGNAVLAELRCALNLSKLNIINGLFYAPLNKFSMYQAGSEHFSEKSFFMEHFGNLKNTYEINIFKNIITNRVTSHIPFRDITKSLSRDKVYDAIKALNDILKECTSDEFKIFVAGLNPHAGESGILGDEEREIILPAIKKAQKNEVNAMGPFSADTVFINAKKESMCGVVTMYHDQGQIAMKLIGFEGGITYQSGFPIPIVTPAHGTAFNIAGYGIANENAAENALNYLCNRVYI